MQMYECDQFFLTYSQCTHIQIQCQAYAHYKAKCNIFVTGYKMTYKTLQATQYAVSHKISVFY